VRRTASEKMEVIRLVDGADLPVRMILRQLGVPSSTFYGWYGRYEAEGFDGLHDQKRAPQPSWNAIPEPRRDGILELALDKPELSPREIACRYTDDERYYVSESSVYRILKDADLITSPTYVLMSAADAFKNPTTRVHEMWQTDFTYFRIINWGWYSLSTELDDYSRYIIAWKLSSTMGAGDVKDTLDDAIAITGVDQVKVRHRPRLLRDNGPAYVSGELREFLKERQMGHTRGRPYHPQAQGKIECWHRTMKNVVTKVATASPQTSRVGGGGSDTEAVLIDPEGTRLTSMGSAKAKVRASQMQEGAIRTIAGNLRYFLPPRTGGTLTLLAGNPEIDVLCLVHSGLESATTGASRVLARPVCRSHLASADAWHPPPLRYLQIQTNKNCGCTADGKK
jgi:putative transposase